MGNHRHKTVDSEAGSEAEDEDDSSASSGDDARREFQKNKQNRLPSQSQVRKRSSSQVRNRDQGQAGKAARVKGRTQTTGKSSGPQDQRQGRTTANRRSSKSGPRNQSKDHEPQPSSTDRTDDKENADGQDGGTGNEEEDEDGTHWKEKCKGLQATLKKKDDQLRKLQGCNNGTAHEQHAIIDQVQATNLGKYIKDHLYRRIKWAPHLKFFTVAYPGLWIKVNKHIGIEGAAQRTLYQASVWKTMSSCFTKCRNYTLKKVKGVYHGK